MDSISKSYKNKGDILNESKYVDKIINHLKNDLLGSRIELKKIFSISTEEYFDILEYEVELINSLKGEIFDTSDPKWSGCGNYEFEFEIDKSHITDRRHPEDEYIIFKGDIIDIDVDVDVHGTVFLESSMLDNPGREWTIGEATNNKTIGYMIISEIRDVITTIIEQRLPILKNLRTLNICNVEEEWVTKLSNEGKGNINEGVYIVGDNNKNLDKVANMMYNESQKMGKNSFPYDSTQTSFNSYVYNTYGLVGDEVGYVFRKFRFLMGWDSYDTTKENVGMDPEDIDYRNTYDGYLNEGVYTRGNQSDYLEYVYNDLVKNTKWRDASFSQVDLYDGKCKSIQIMIRWGSAAPYFLAIPECLENHLKNIYGLTWEEIKELFWGRYEEYVINMVLDKKQNISPHIRARVGYLRESVMDYQISDQGTMGTLLPESTKSVGDNSEFLNKMIDYLVDATELIEVPHHPKIRVKYPFVDYSPNNKIPHMWYESIPKVIFIVGIMENYGVNTEEAHFVLDEYREKLRDKVKTKLP
tara:strand:+ start:817 stop:2400 length:1584 start_codon:yes stop_codon:yes gene_type:complete